MTKYQTVEEKLDEALKLTKTTGKAHQFDICQSGAPGAEITTTNIQEVDSEKKCSGTKLGSFRTYSESTSPKDQPGV